MESNDLGNGNDPQGVESVKGGDERSVRLGGGRRSGRRTAGVRSRAVREAREAKQARDARLRERELAVELVLAEYYAATGQAGEIWRRARERAERIQGEAEAATAGLMADADEALRRLRTLGESREAIRELTRLSAGRLRLALTEHSKEALMAEAAGQPKAARGDGGAANSTHPETPSREGDRRGRHAEEIVTAPLWEEANEPGEGFG